MFFTGGQLHSRRGVLFCLKERHSNDVEGGVTTCWKGTKVKLYAESDGVDNCMRFEVT